jgi:hypothetical protein
MIAFPWPELAKWLALCANRHWFTPRGSRLRIGIGGRLLPKSAPLTGKWLPELLRASAADLCSSRMASPQAERPFSVSSFYCVRFCCGRAGVAPQAVVGHDALPPAPVLGYSNTFFFVSSAPTRALSG